MASSTLKVSPTFKPLIVIVPPFTFTVKPSPSLAVILLPLVAVTSSPVAKETVPLVKVTFLPSKSKVSSVVPLKVLSFTVTEPLGALICVAKSTARLALSAILTVLIPSAASSVPLRVSLSLLIVRVANFVEGLVASSRTRALVVAAVKSSVPLLGTIILLHVTSARSESSIAVPARLSLMVPSSNIKPTAVCV